MVLKIETRAEVLKQYLDVISILQEETLLHFKPDGMECSVVDPSHVAMVHAELRKEAFDKYESSDITVGLDLGKLVDFMKIVKSTDQMEMEMDEGENMLILRAGTITRSMSLIDVTTLQETKLPQLTHIARVSVKTSELDRGIKAAEKLTEQITLILNKDGFEMNGKSDREKVNLKIPKDRLEEFDCNEDIKSTYSLEFLSRMIKVASASEMISMLLNKNYPLQMEFDIAGGSGRTVYLLAPRMD